CGCSRASGSATRGSGIGPVGILEDHQDRTGTGQQLDLYIERFERSVPPLRGGQVERGISPIVGERQHLGEKPGVLAAGRGLREKGVELVEVRARRSAVREAGSAFELADDRVKRTVRVLG